MRLVVKNECSRDIRLMNEATYQALLELIRTGDKSLISEKIYRDAYDTPDGKRSRVEDQLARYYLYKCAYCERICKADIEHYRPKKGVDEQKDHPGYYWLSYEWTNLLPSCITCNREGAKHNHFPILGERVYGPLLTVDDLPLLETFKAASSPLADERPLLLHPEVDRPEDYFAFEVGPAGEGIRIVGIDAGGRGEGTIQLCKLNRQEITLDRVEAVVDYFKVAVHCLFAQLQAGEINETEFQRDLLQQLRLLKAFSLAEDKTHTYLRKYIVRSIDNFERIMLPFLDEKIRTVLLEAFRSSNIWRSRVIY